MSPGFSAVFSVATTPAGCRPSFRVLCAAHIPHKTTPHATLEARASRSPFSPNVSGITEHDLETYLSEALSAGGDYANSLGIDEQIVKSATEGVSMGAGVRVIAAERTGYAYSDDLSPAKIRKAAHTAALIAKGPASCAVSQDL